MKVILLKDMVDRHGRKYDKSEMTKQTTNKTFMGELGIGENNTIDIARVSHKISNVKVEGNDLVGYLEILDTPMGNIVKSIYDNFIEPKTSIRAVGEVDENMNVRNLTLITFDLEMI